MERKAVGDMAAHNPVPRAVQGRHYLECNRQHPRCGAGYRACPARAVSAWLCVRFGLTSENVIRHYDVTGKNCPKYYVENPDAWIQMKSDIAAQIDVDYGLQDVQ